MPKTIADIKTAANQLAQRAKLGQIDEKTLISVVNDLVNYLAAKADAAPLAEIIANKAVEHIQNSATVPTDAVKPKRAYRRKGATNPVTDVSEAVIGSKVPTPTDSVDLKAGSTRTLPLNIKAGKGITVGTKSPVNTGVTVGSAPAAPAGQITVGGRPRKV